MKHRNVLSLCLLAIIDLLAASIISIQAPFFPEVASGKGASATEYGWVFGIFEFTAIIFSPIFGAQMRVLGPMRVFTAGIVTTGVCSVIFGFLNRIHGHSAFIGWCIFIRFLESIGDSAYVTASYTIVAMEFPEYVATTFSVFETCTGVGMILGPIVGGVLYEMGGYSLPFISMGGALFLLATVSILVLPECSDENNKGELTSQSKNAVKTGIFNFLKIPEVWLTSYAITVAATGVGFLTALLEPHLRKFQLSKVSLASVIMLSGGAFAIAAPLWGWTCDKKKINPKLLCLFGAAISIFGFILIGPVPWMPFETILWVTCIGLVLFGLGMGAIFVSGFTAYLQDAISNDYSDDVSTYGLVAGCWTCVTSLGYGIGPTVGGLLEDHMGFCWGSMFLIGANCLLVGWLSVYFLRNVEHRVETCIDVDLKC